ncbi:N-succinylarginine dihydrolase [Sphingomonas agri]|uniref:N-succinylarginine dihydrolase n=1 Tax=Sphingomonas agri TaxID=1813878 RepID=UPI00311D8100
MMLREINFDGIVGPSHNYAGLSLGNLASARSAGEVSKPRSAALQGLDKMRANLALGLTQGIFLPHARPDHRWLAELGTSVDGAEPALAANAMSASAMWAANAATVSPSPDTRDGKCHLTAANLRTMPHRSHEWPQTLAQLQLAFASDAFAVHAPVPAAFGDEGAANHMRLSSAHDARGVEVFVYGVTGGAFPARQHLEASKAVARLHRLDPALTLFVQQSEEAIAAGAFHNDVVAVANERVLFAHELAFSDKAALLDALQTRVPDFEYLEVAAADVPLADAIRSYLFNAQLVTPPDGQPTLILPTEASETPSVRRWIEQHVAGNGPVRRAEFVDVRQSMANGGGPACLRLRVAADPATIDSRFLVDDQKLDTISQVIERYWPDQIHHDDLQEHSLLSDIERARAALLDRLDLAELL